jgi:DNA-binding NarL/FixJ family response regulator
VNASKKIRVLIADDQRLMLDGIASLLQEYPDLEIVDLAGHGAEALQKAQISQPDVVLLDVRMPVMDGISAIAPLRAQLPGCKILMLTTFDDDEYIVQAMQQGAAGYLLKDTPAAELAEAIRVVYRGAYVFDPRSGQKLAQLVGRDSSPLPTKRRANEFEQLSEREQEVTLLVARGYSNREIATRLSITEGTVKNHLSNILAALHLSGRAQIIVFAYEQGLMQH